MVRNEYFSILMTLWTFRTFYHRALSFYLWVHEKWSPSAMAFVALMLTYFTSFTMIPIFNPSLFWIFDMYQKVNFNKRKGGTPFVDGLRVKTQTNYTYKNQTQRCFMIWFSILTGSLYILYTVSSTSSTSHLLYCHEISERKRKCAFSISFKFWSDQLNVNVSHFQLIRSMTFMFWNIICYAIFHYIT